jgi:hypothetical protein
MSWVPPIARDARVIIGAFGVMAVGSLYVMHTLLTQVRDEAEIKPAQPKTQYITQDTEDALKFSTLDTLLGHYNYAIKDTASKIVCDRAANDGVTLDVLLYGITRPDYDERMKNLRALAYITDQNTLPLIHKHKKAYSALVRSLELCLPPERSEQDKLDDRYYDEFPLRDMVEKMCLMFVSQLVHRFDAKELVRARFVEKWLAKQYWGDSPDEVLANFTMYMNVRENRVAEIVKHIIECRTGREALVKCGLITQATKEQIEEPPAGRVGRYQYMLSMDIIDDGDENPDRPVGGRPQEQSVEEQRLRHRHREAMVFNDGTRPLNSQDIIQRDHGSPALLPSRPSDRASAALAAREMEDIDP